MKSSQESRCGIGYLPKPNSKVVKCNSYRVTLRNEFNRIDRTLAINRLFGFHLDGIVNADHFHIGFEENYLIDLLEVINFLNLPIVGSPINDLSRLHIEHVHLSCILGVVSDLMLDQVGGKISKFDC